MKGFQLGNRAAVGRKASAESKAISALIVLLRDKRGLSYAQIARRLESDLGIALSRMAICQRYHREKQK